MPVIPETLVGHEKERAHLLADIAHRNISHAYLFVGPPHIGKFTIARWFAWRILADSVQPDDVATVKDQVERLIHPDLLSLDMLWMEEAQDDWNVIGQYSNVAQQHRAKGTPAKTDTIGIKEIEVLQGRLFETGQSPHLCCLIRSAERMSTEAANAFLKVLEDPPPRVVVILTAESEHAVLPTVASRTRVVKFYPLKTEEMKSLLGDRTDDEAAFALHLAQGAPGTLIRLLADPDTLRSRRQLHAQAKQFWSAGTAHERLGWIMEFADGRQDLTELLFHLGIALREHPSDGEKQSFFPAYMELLQGLQTNAHRGLLFERFTLAITHL